MQGGNDSLTMGGTTREAASDIPRSFAEAGAPSSNISDERTTPCRKHHPRIINGGTRGISILKIPRRCLYFFKKHPNGGRVNLAICSHKMKPEAFIVDPGPGWTTHRGWNGLRIMFTPHAFSGGGGDAPELVTSKGPQPWYALGD